MDAFLEIDLVVGEKGRGFVEDRVALNRGENNV